MLMQQILAQIRHMVWERDLTDAHYWQKAGTRFLRIMAMVVRDLKGGMLTLRAMSLVYTTLLSFVPLLAVSFSVLKGFGVRNQIEPMLLNLLSSLGDKGVELTQNIVGFVENMKIGVLGALGLGLLMFTVISLIQKIESAFNFTWRLSGSRNLSQRFSNYLSVVMVGPVLIFSAIGITASLRNHAIVSSIQSLPYMGGVIQLLGYLVPYVLIIAAFSFVYVLVPNTRVKPLSALYGAVVAGLLWRWTGMLFAGFASGSTSYTAIYSGFAILLLFMIWLYLGWLILLIGASIAYYHQHPESLHWDEGSQHMSALLRENLCLQLMVEIASEHYHANGLKTSRRNLSQSLKVPQSMIERMLNTLQKCDLIVATRAADPSYLPARAIDKIDVLEVLECARLAEDGNFHQQLKLSASVSELQQQIDAARQQLVSAKTIKDLIVL
jgi:membrane protein